MTVTGDRYGQPTMTQIASLLTVGLVAARIGESDCEELGTGLLVQPINALTSFAYVGVGLAIAIVALRRRGNRVSDLVYAACLVAVGLGSVAFHGPQPLGSRLMHDLPILVTALFIATEDLALLLPRFRRPLAAFVGLAAVATVLTIVSVGAAATATGVVLVAVAGAELLIYRRGLRPAADRRQRNAYLLIMGVAALAGASWLLGRTGGPACDPDGVFQFHGVWHVLSSLVFGLWWWLATRASGEQQSDSEPRRSEAGL